MQEFHRSGVGKELFRAGYSYAKEKGYLYMQVKTVKERCYKAYDKTNSFYKSIGFKELECLPTLWDESNPCQIYILSIE